MPKRALFLIVAFIFVFCITGNAFAADETGIDAVLAKKDAELTQYADQIEVLLKANVQNPTGEVFDIMSYNLDKAYRFNFTHLDLLTSYAKAGSFPEVFEDETARGIEMRWKVPAVIRNNETTEVQFSKEIDKGISMDLIGNGPDAEERFITNDEIRKAVTDAGKADAPFDSLEFAFSYLYSTTFAYLTAGEETYLIAHSRYAKELGIENGKLYTEAEMMERFNRCFDESWIEEARRIRENGGNLQLGSGPEFRRKVTPAMIGAGVIVAAAGITAVLVIRKRKTQKISIAA